MRARREVAERATADTGSPQPRFCPRSPVCKSSWAASHHPELGEGGFSPGVMFWLSSACAERCQHASNGLWSSLSSWAGRDVLVSGCPRYGRAGSRTGAGPWNRWIIYWSKASCHLGTARAWLHGGWLHGGDAQQSQSVSGNTRRSSRSAPGWVCDAAFRGVGASPGTAGTKLPLEVSRDGNIIPMWNPELSILGPWRPSSTAELSWRAGSWFHNDYSELPVPFPAHSPPASRLPSSALGTWGWPGPLAKLKLHPPTPLGTPRRFHVARRGVKRRGSTAGAGHHWQGGARFTQLTWPSPKGRLRIGFWKNLQEGWCDFFSFLSVWFSFFFFSFPWFNVQGLQGLFCQPSFVMAPGECLLWRPSWHGDNLSVYLPALQIWGLSCQQLVLALITRSLGFLTKGT